MPAILGSTERIDLLSDSMRSHVAASRTLAVLALDLTIILPRKLAIGLQFTVRHRETYTPTLAAVGARYMYRKPPKYSWGVEALQKMC